MAGYNKTDYYIAIAVASQPLLCLIQLLLLHILRVPADQTTFIRVLLVMVVMLPAIVMSVTRKSVLFLLVYGIVAIILSLTAVVHPANVPYIQTDGFRFLLPIVIPTALCLICLPSFSIFESAMNIVAWGSFALSLLFIFAFITGRMEFYGYDMTLSYGLLFPMGILYSQKHWASYLASIILFLFIIAIGCRGAAVAFILYMTLDAILYHRSRLLPITVFALVFIFTIPSFINFLSSFGIVSRSLTAAVNDELMNSSGRDDIQNTLVEALADKPILGYGVWGDRVVAGAYSHNIFMEILFDFGWLFGGGIILIAILYLIRTYKRLSPYLRPQLLKYSCLVLIPLFLSGSYLTSVEFGLYIGVLYLLNHDTSLSQQCHA